MKTKTQNYHGELRRSSGLPTLQPLRATLWARNCAPCHMNPNSSKAPWAPRPQWAAGHLGAGCKSRHEGYRAPPSCPILVRPNSVYHSFFSPAAGTSGWITNPMLLGASHWVAPGKAIYGQMQWAWELCPFQEPTMQKPRAKRITLLQLLPIHGPPVCHGILLGKLKFNTFIQKIPSQAVCQEFSAKENKTTIMGEMEQLTGNYNFIWDMYKQ